jgi:hypothetical protein
MASYNGAVSRVMVDDNSNELTSFGTIVNRDRGVTHVHCLWLAPTVLCLFVLSARLGLVIHVGGLTFWFAFSWHGIWLRLVSLSRTGVVKWLE